jgi:hypothetical protein
LIAKCIAMWSEVELQLGLMMAAFLGEVAVPTVAIYIDMLAFRTRMEALTAAAPNVLNREQHEIFEALVAFARTATRRRDKLAHGLWTYSDEIPDALLLVDTRDRLPQYTHAIIRALRGEKVLDADTMVPSKLISVYRPKDLQQLHAEFEHLQQCMVTFNKMVLLENNVAEQYRLYYALFHEPRIHEFVVRQRQPQKSGPSIYGQWPPLDFFETG